MMNFLKIAAGITLMAAMASPGSPVEAQSIYKIVDEDGNIIYTDRPPTPGAQPIELRALSVVERPEYQTRSSSRQSAADSDDGAMTIDKMKRQYRDFKLVSPAPDQTFWGTSNLATVAWDSRTALLPGMAVQVYIDDQPFGAPTTNSVIPTERLDRGEHKVRATLIDDQRRAIANAGPVTFHIKQQSALNRARRG